MNHDAIKYMVGGFLLLLLLIMFLGILRMMIAELPSKEERKVKRLEAQIRERQLRKELLELEGRKDEA